MVSVDVKHYVYLLTYLLQTISSSEKKKRKKCTGVVAPRWSLFVVRSFYLEQHKVTSLGRETFVPNQR